jgi:hypothetical protein
MDSTLQTPRPIGKQSTCLSPGLGRSLTTRHPFIHAQISSVINIQIKIGTTPGVLYGMWEWVISNTRPPRPEKVPFITNQKISEQP